MAWTPDRLAALRQRATALREMLPDPADLAAEHARHALLDAEQEQAREISTAYAAGPYQSQQAGYEHDAPAVLDPYIEIDPDPDL
ncbi:MAG TPA: hypothetical protein VFW65_21880 [Pseudonocardiaceae bacterium]|nr:hypothetical protein [Pseudonocardiaceae bacterium]